MYMSEYYKQNDIHARKPSCDNGYSKTIEIVDLVFHVICLILKNCLDQMCEKKTSISSMKKKKNK